MTPPVDAESIPIRVRGVDIVLLGHLDDNPAARALLAQLPLTLTFRHFNGVEMIAPLPKPLPMDGMPAGADPELQDLGYFAPSGDLVIYYGDVGYWDGIAILGRFDTDLAVLATHQGTFTATVEGAN